MRTLRQPLMDVVVASSSDEDDDGGGLLLHSPSSVRGLGTNGDAVAGDSWATRRKRRRRKDDDDLGEVRTPRGVLRVEPKLLRSFSRWLLSLSSAAAVWTSSRAAKAKTSPRADKAAAALLGRSHAHSTRAADPVEDMAERALAWMAGLTLALALLLIVAVARQSS